MQTENDSYSHLCNYPSAPIYIVVLIPFHFVTPLEIVSMIWLVPDLCSSIIIKRQLVWNSLPNQLYYLICERLSTRVFFPVVKYVMKRTSTPYMVHCIINEIVYYKGCQYVLHVTKSWIFRSVRCKFSVSVRVSHNFEPHCTYTE